MVFVSHGILHLVRHSDFTSIRMWGKSNIFLKPLFLKNDGVVNSVEEI